jgi:uncharacterized protein
VSEPHVGVVVPAADPPMPKLPMRGVGAGVTPLPFETNAPDPAIPRGDWALTFSGRKFYPLSPKVDVVCLDDIAQSLSLQCRFAGHVPVHYSVAQHSVLVAQLCSPASKLLGLLHDASEAYCQDIIRPLKRELGQAYAEIERIWARTIGLAFGLGDQLADPPAEVHDADRKVLVAERKLFQPNWAWPVEEMYPERIEPWSPARARAEFVRHFRMYGGAA